MSQNESRCDEAQSISQPGPRAMHVKHCDECGREADGKVILPDDLEAHEIAHVTGNMCEADHKATREANDFKPKEADSDRTATAKALISAKGGGKDRYTEVFGQCATDECDYGANGFEADHCTRSDHSPDPSGDASEASEATDESERIAYVKELIDVGVSPTKAEEAAIARFDS